MNVTSFVRPLQQPYPDSDVDSKRETVNGLQQAVNSLQQTICAGAIDLDAWQVAASR
jgi:hypothetical protein